MGTMGWLSQGKCVPQYGGVKIHRVFIGSLEDQDHYVLAYSSLFELSEKNFLAMPLYIKGGIGL